MDPDSDDRLLFCCCCGHEIYAGERYVSWQADEFVCEDCDESSED